MKILIFKGLQELQKHIFRNKESYSYSSPLRHNYYLFPKAFRFFWYLRLQQSNKKETFSTVGPHIRKTKKALHK